jgi:hypothetical protein
MSASFLPKRPVITAYPKMPEAFAEAEAMAAFLKEKGIHAPYGSLYDENLRKAVKKGEYDMLIAVGGDGSVLRAGHLCAPWGVPILGVNLGRLGFLIQIDRKEWHEYLDKLFNGEAWIENRMMLRAEHIRTGESIGNSIALNEVVVAPRTNPAPHSFNCLSGFPSINKLCRRRVDRFHSHGGQRPTPSQQADLSCRRNCETFCLYRLHLIYRLTGPWFYQKVLL